MYSGWLTVASILNVTHTLKAFGFNQTDNEINETNQAIWILCISECLFITFTMITRNPFYGAIYIWALFAIKKQQKDFERMQTLT